MSDLWPAWLEWNATPAEIIESYPDYERVDFDKALDEVDAAGPEDDVYGLLKDLENTVEEVRDGGIVGSGANGHRRALEDYRKAKEGTA